MLPCLWLQNYSFGLRKRFARGLCYGSLTGHDQLGKTSKPKPRSDETVNRDFRKPLTCPSHHEGRLYMVQPGHTLASEVFRRQKLKMFDVDFRSKPTGKLYRLQMTNPVYLGSSQPFISQISVNTSTSALCSLKSSFKFQQLWKLQSTGRDSQPRSLFQRRPSLGASIASEQRIGIGPSRAGTLLRHRDSLSLTS